MQKNKQTHIVHIIPTLRIGGAERVVVDLVNNSSKQFVHDIVLFFDDMELAADIEPGKARVHVVKKRGKLDVGLIWRLRKQLMQLQPDVVHTHLFGADIWGRIAARMCGVPVVTTEHNVNTAEGVLKTVVKRMLRGLSAYYIAISETVQEDMQRRYGIAKTRITVIRNGIALDRFASVAPVEMQTPLRVLMLGRLVKQKGFDIGLRAIAACDAPVIVDVVGDGEERSSLEQLSRTLKIEDRVTFHTSSTNVVQLYQNHDVVLIPSRWEGLGLVAMEAMAAGRVVIASDVDGLRELLTDTQNGLLVASESTAIAAAIDWVATHTDDAQVIAGNARRQASRYDISGMVAQYEKLYSMLVSQL